MFFAFILKTMLNACFLLILNKILDNHKKHINQC